MQNQQTHHLDPPETPQENIKIEEEGQQMSKRTQRIAWDDLKPGDTIHVHGSSNTYTYNGYATVMEDRHRRLHLDVTAKGISDMIYVSRDEFDYATRKLEPATRKHTRVQPPQTDGEHYLASSAVTGTSGTLVEIIFNAQAYSRIMRVSNARNRWRLDLDGTWKEYVTWGQLLGDFDDHDRDVTEAITAEEFYQRKYKQAA